MTTIALLILAMHGFHSTPEKCERITDSLCELLSYKVMHDSPRPVASEELKRIEKFYQECKAK